MTERERWCLRAVLLAYGIGVLVYRDSIMDDTFIHLQYARNLREAGELAFNRGEPSLGATSPLWILLLAAVGHGVLASHTGVPVMAIVSAAARAKRSPPKRLS